MHDGKKIVILRGNSGSGKTTTAKALQQKLGYGTMLISQDVVRREMLYVRDGADTPAVSLLLDLVKYGRQHCDVVILEGILHAAWYEELFAWIHQAYGQEIYAYYFDLPFEETLHRHSSKPNHMEFGEKEMRKWWTDQDFLKQFPETTLTKEMALSETVDLIYKKIMVTHKE